MRFWVSEVLQSWLARKVSLWPGHSAVICVQCPTCSYLCISALHQLLLELSSILFDWASWEPDDDDFIWWTESRLHQFGKQAWRVCASRFLLVEQPLKVLNCGSCWFPRKELLEPPLDPCSVIVHHFVHGHASDNTWQYPVFHWDSKREASLFQE